MSATEKTIDAALAAEVDEYKTALGEVKFDGHPGEGYLLAGFQDGFKRGFKAGTGAAHAGISTVVGNIDNGMYDLDDAKSALIALRNVIQSEAKL